MSKVSHKEDREAAAQQRTLARGNVDPIKEHQRQRREAACNLHRLSDVARDAFESRKAELKGDGVAGR